MVLTNCKKQWPKFGANWAMSMPAEMGGGGELFSWLRCLLMMASWCSPWLGLRGLSHDQHVFLFLSPFYLLFFNFPQTASIDDGENSSYLGFGLESFTNKRPCLECLELSMIRTLSWIFADEQTLRGAGSCSGVTPLIISVIGPNKSVQV